MYLSVIHSIGVTIMRKKAVIIFSGGLDSTTCLGMAMEKGLEVHALTFNYGQRHSKEVEQAKKITNYYNIKNHKIIDISFLKMIGGSSLTDQSMEIPTNGIDNGIPLTYVPARNMIFLSLAAAYAEVIKASYIYTGVSAIDYSGYPDCRPEFIESMNDTINLGTSLGLENSIEIITPLIQLTKAATIKKGMELGVPYHLTVSCYKGEEIACGKCDSCRLRLKGFQEADVMDPIIYA